MKSFPLHPLSLAVTACIFGQSLLPAALGATYVLDEAQSAVTLSGSVKVQGITVALNEQAPGSLTANYGGTLNVTSDGVNVQFNAGSELVALETKSYEPGASGVPGSAPASYAAQATATIIFFTATAKAASRRVKFGVTSPSISLSGSTFPSGLVNYQFVDTANSVVDFNVSGAINAKGSKVLSGLLTNRVSGNATILGKTLTIPVDAVFNFVAETDSSQKVEFNLAFQGKLVANEGSAPEQPVVQYDPPAGPGQPLTLHWSPSYKLQRATSIPPVWVDVPVNSPYEVPTTKPGEFFHVVKKN